MHSLTRPLNVLLLLVLVLGPASFGADAAYRAQQFEVDITRDVVYGVGLTAPEGRGPGSTALRLDVYEPRGHAAPDKPAVVLVHGGAFVGGDKRDLSGAALELASRGYVCFSIGYRLMPLNPPEGRDAGLADAQQAVRWVRHNADRYGVDPERVAALGHSAGAYVVIGLAVVDDDLTAEDGATLDIFGTSAHSARIQAAVSVAGGLNYADAFDSTDPPMMMVHAQDDPIVSFDGALRLRDACERHAIPYVLAASESGGHDPWNADFDGQSLWDAVADFLAASLVDQHVPLTMLVEGQGAVLPEGVRGEFPRNTSAGLRAEPAVGHVFRGWHGDASGETPQTTVAMDGPKTVRAVFEALPDDVHYTLTLGETLHGTVKLDPPGGAYAPGTQVTLRAEPAMGRLFGYWTGDIRSADAETTVLMDRDRSVTPGFMEDPSAERHALEVRVDGPGRVRIVPEQETYVIGTQVMLVAEPAPGGAFAGWRGSAEGTASRLRLTVEAPHSVTAAFYQVVEAAPTEWAVPQEGGSEVVHFSFDHAADHPDPGWRPEWAPPWLEIAALEAPGQLLLAAAPNFSSYTRLCRVRFFAEGARPFHVVGMQPGTTRAAQPAAPGLAVYTGADGEWGALQWHEPNMPPDLLVLEPNMEGGFAVGAFRGAVVGFLGAEDGQPLRIPDGARYDIHAAWSLPADPLAFSDPAEPDAGRPSYLYLGVDSGGIEFTKIRYGIEWKDIGNGPEWVLRGQRHIIEASAAAANGGQTPREIEVHIWKDPAGDAEYGERGGAAIFGRFRLDGGAWQDYMTEFGTPFVPVERMAYDSGDDLVTFKVRGLGTRHLHDLRVVGENVPGVNTGLGGAGAFGR